MIDYFNNVLKKKGYKGQCEITWKKSCAKFYYLNYQYEDSESTRHGEITGTTGLIMLMLGETSDALERFKSNREEFFPSRYAHQGNQDFYIHIKSKNYQRIVTSSYYNLVSAAIYSGNRILISFVLNEMKKYPGDYWWNGSVSNAIASLTEEDSKWFAAEYPEYAVRVRLKDVLLQNNIYFLTLNRKIYIANPIKFEENVQKYLLMGVSHQIWKYPISQEEKKNYWKKKGRILHIYRKIVSRDAFQQSIQRQVLNILFSCDGEEDKTAIEFALNSIKSFRSVSFNLANDSYLRNCATNVLKKLAWTLKSDGVDVNFFVDLNRGISFSHFITVLAVFSIFPKKNFQFTYSYDKRKFDVISVSIGLQNLFLGNFFSEGSTITYSRKEVLKFLLDIIKNETDPKNALEVYGRLMIQLARKDNSDTKDIFYDLCNLSELKPL